MYTHLQEVAKIQLFIIIPEPGVDEKCQGDDGDGDGDALHVSPCSILYST